MIRQWCTEEFPSLFFNVDLSWQWSGFFCRVLRWHFATVVAVVTTAHAGVFWTSGVRCVAVDGCVVCAALGEVTGVVTSYSVVAFPGFLFFLSTPIFGLIIQLGLQKSKSQGPTAEYGETVVRKSQGKHSTIDIFYINMAWRTRLGHNMHELCVVLCNKSKNSDGVRYVLHCRVFCFTFNFYFC